MQNPSMRLIGNGSTIGPAISHGFARHLECSIGRSALEDIADRKTEGKLLLDPAA